MPTVYHAYQKTTHPDWLNDDALITLTYAKNITLGHGFVFNHPPATLGSTTPLLTLILGLIGRIISGISLTSLAVCFGAPCRNLFLWSPFLFRRTLGLSVGESLLAALMLSVTGHVNQTYLESEFPLFELLLVVCAVLFLKGEFALAGIGGGLLFLTRGEGCLLMPVLVLAMPFRFPQSRRLLLRDVMLLSAGFFFVFGIWCCFAYPAFHDIFPNTLRAKLAQTNLPGTGFLPFRTDFWSRSLSWETRLFHIYSLNWNDIRFSKVATIAFWLFFAGGVWVVTTDFKRNAGWAIVLGWAVAYVVAYAVMNPPCYPWYSLHAYFAWLLIAAVGMVRGLARLRRNASRTARVSYCVALAGIVFLLSVRVVHTAIDYGIPEVNRDVRGAAYLEIAQWLKTNSSPEDMVIHGEMGYLGYYTDNTLLDAAGLISPLNVAVLQASGSFETAFVRLVQYFGPKYIVMILGNDVSLKPPEIPDVGCPNVPEELSYAASAQQSPKVLFYSLVVRSDGQWFNGTPAAYCLYQRQ